MKKKLYFNHDGSGQYIWKKDELIDLTFSEVLDRVADEFPDQYCFKYTTLDYVRTYEEFRDDVDQFAKALISMGVKAGSKVSIWATNVPAWYITFWATTKIGAVLVTVNTAYKIHEAGFPVGITTSVTIDHATPASFYANSAARSDYYDIAEQLPQSGFEFFGGGGFYGVQNPKEKEKSLYDIASEAGYEFAYGTDEYEAKKAGAEKMILFQKGDKKNSDLPYVQERVEGDLELPQVVESAIDFLNNEDGFFLMVEGGKIDWAAHSNDLAGTVFEMLDFDRAVAVAYEFYKQHPEETLIVVTADHETGGVTLGREKGYVYDLSVVVPSGKRNGEDGTDVSNYMSGVSVDSLSKVAKIGWTTTSHTGGAVPVFAIGAGSGMFAGRQDNTDIPEKICRAMGVKF